MYIHAYMHTYIEREEEILDDLPACIVLTTCETGTNHSFLILFGRGVISIMLGLLFLSCRIINETFYLLLNV